jgi:hypothetical protein
VTSHISSYTFSVCYFCELKVACFNGGIIKQHFQIFLPRERKKERKKKNYIKKTHTVFFLTAKDAQI